MKKTAIFIVLILSLNLFANNDAWKNDAWYKCFKGKIGVSPVTVHLERQDKQITGYYYYDKYMMPLVIFGGIEGDSLSLLAYSNSYVTENFSGVLHGGVYKGQWDLNDKKLEFTLEEDTKLSAMFEYPFVKGEKKLIKDFKNSPTVSYLQGSVWPGEKYPDFVFLRKALAEEMGFSAMLSDVKPKMEANMRKYFDDYFRDNKDLTKKELEDIGWPTSYNMSAEDYISAVYYDKNMFVAARFNYAYTGGAHGNYGTSYSVYDLAMKRKLKIDDVITSEGKLLLPALLEKNYRLQNNVSDTLKLSEELFVDTIYVTENFALTPGAMMFSYPPYDIASYAAGEIRIYVPVAEVEKYLKPRALELIKQ